MIIKRAARTVIFDDNQKVAVLKVRGGAYYKIPGGGIEEGESDEEAAIREAREEAGCEIELLAKLGEDEFPDPSGQKMHWSICFLAKVKGEKKRADFDDWEKSNDFELLWLPYDEAIDLFNNAEPDDAFGQAINRRDLDYLEKGYFALKDTQLL